MIVDHSSEEDSEATPVWAVFGDLMACLFGLFVLFFVWAIAFQVDLSRELRLEREARASEKVRLESLERALEGPLASGRITLDAGTIAIRGSVLFSLNSAELRPEGLALLKDLATPLSAYLSERDELLMVSGFTDDLALGTRAGFKDNWELSTERALTVTRTLVAAGVPSNQLFAAGFGENHPVAPNSTSEGRARNRRVEISPIPRLRKPSS